MSSGSCTNRRQGTGSRHTSPFPVQNQVELPVIFFTHVPPPKPFSLAKGCFMPRSRPPGHPSVTRNISLHIDKPQPWTGRPALCTLVAGKLVGHQFPSLLPHALSEILGLGLAMLSICGGDLLYKVIKKSVAARRKLSCSSNSKTRLCRPPISPSDSQPPPLFRHNIPYGTSKGNGVLPYL